MYISCLEVRFEFDTVLIILNCIHINDSVDNDP